MGAIKFSDGVDLVDEELLNMVVQKLAADPALVEGKIYYNTGSKKYRYCDGTAWLDVSSSGAGDVVGPASAIDSELVLFNGTTGKLIKRSALTGLAKLVAGVLSAAVAGTDYTTPSSTEAFTNKTFNANGTGNSISNLETNDFAAGVLNTDTGLSGATNTQVPSALAAKTYADNLLAANDAMVLKGSIDASANPNYPAADAGHTYKITVAGKVGGASGADVQVGDTLYCTVDGTAAGNQATVGANWVIVQSNVDRATTSVLGLTQYATQVEAEAKAETTKTVTPSALVNFPIKKTFTIGNGSATSFTLPHNLNTLDVVVTARKVSTGERLIVSNTSTDVNNVNVVFGTAPTTNEFVITIMG